MKIETKHLVLFIRLLILSAIFVSCTKELPPCTQYCDGVIFSGYIYDRSDNLPISNQYVEIVLQQSYPPCWLCLPNKLVSGYSNGQGYFKFNVIFDTSLMKTYTLSVNVPPSGNYIQYAEPVGPGIGPSNNSESQIFGSIDTTAFRNLIFWFYKPTLLYVNVHRTTPIVTQEPSFFLSFKYDGRESDWGFDQSDSNVDTTLTINTAANIFTAIRSSKFVTDSSVETRTDSIKCVLKKKNSIEIYY